MFPSKPASQPAQACPLCPLVLLYLSLCELLLQTVRTKERAAKQASRRTNERTSGRVVVFHPFPILIFPATLPSLLSASPLLSPAQSAFKFSERVRQERWCGEQDDYAEDRFVLPRVERSPHILLRWVSSTSFASEKIGKAFFDQFRVGGSG